MNKLEHITQQEFDNLTMVNNNVLIEIPEVDNLETRPSGIILIKDVSLLPQYTQEDLKNDVSLAETVSNTKEADLAARWGTVAKLPKSLKFNKDGKHPEYMAWETDIEVKVGDKVWFGYHRALHCTIFVVDNNKKYWCFPYENLIVAKTPEIKMLNGYCLFKRLNTGLVSKYLELPEHIDKQKGIVKYIGSKNRSYANKSKFDDVNIKEGDIVVFRNSVELLLEPKEHMTFDTEELRYYQRSEVYAAQLN